MPSRPRLIAALIACCLLTACASSPKPSAALPPPLPAALLQGCPPPAEVPQSGEMDAMAMTLKAMYDLYGECAGQLADLVNWLEREH